MRSHQGGIQISDVAAGEVLCGTDPNLILSSKTFYSYCLEQGCFRYKIDVE